MTGTVSTEVRKSHEAVGGRKFFNILNVCHSVSHQGHSVRLSQVSRVPLCSLASIQLLSIHAK